jgi:hypothetical protein
MPMNLIHFMYLRKGKKSRHKRLFRIHISTILGRFLLTSSIFSTAHSYYSGTEGHIRFCQVSCQYSFSNRRQGILTLYLKLKYCTVLMSNHCVCVIITCSFWTFSIAEGDLPVSTILTLSNLSKVFFAYLTSVYPLRSWNCLA